MTVSLKWTRVLAPLAASAVVMAAGAVMAQEKLGRVEQSPGGGTNRFISAADQAQIHLLIAQADGAVSERDWPQAEALLRRALALDWDEVRSINTLGLLAEVYESQGRFAEAVTARQSVLEQAEEAWGGEDGSPRLAEYLNLARALDMAGRLEEAERNYRQVLALSTDALGDYEPGHHSEEVDGPHVATFAILENLGSLLGRLGRSREMAELYREVLPLYIAAVGEEDQYTRAVRARLVAAEAS